jgi:ribonuclease HII
MTRIQRHTVFSELKDKIDWVSHKVTARKISDGENLNDLEALGVIRILRVLGVCDDVDEVIVDNFDQRKETLMRRMERLGFKLDLYPSIRWVFEHGAEIYPACALASIFAKELSEMELDFFTLKFGFMGTGNPGDEATKRFLRRHMHMDCSDGCEIIRKNWVTYRKLYELFKEDVLGDVCGFG